MTRRAGGRRLRGATRQLRGPLRPAAQPDLQAQARHHRGRALPGHRRVHRAREGRRTRSGTSTRRRRSCWSRPPCSTSRRPGWCPQGDVEDEEDLALLEARDLLFARLLQYRAFKGIAGGARGAAGGGGQAAPALGRAGGPVRDPAARGADRHRPRPVRGAGGQGARAQAGRSRSACSHIHATRVSVREQAAIVVERLRRQGAMTFRALCGDSPDTLTTVARFLSLLELFREGAVGFDQVTPLGELTVRWTGERRRGRRGPGDRRVRRRPARGRGAAEPEPRAEAETPEAE